MKEFYKNTVGFCPYAYQLKVMELLLSGKNIILSVPTGAGKTWASVIPFLYAQTRPDIHFPKKMIYSLPLRTLTNSIYEDVTGLLKKQGYSEETITRQTGEYSDDRYFEKDIIFSTIDQTLSNFLCFPLPLSPRQANINAGALIGSYLVFDEFHLLDKERSMATTIGMLDILGSLCRCCIMTATLSDGFMQAIQKELPNYEIITLEDFSEDKLKIGSLKPETSKKKIKVSTSPLSISKIIEYHINKTIVICNRVEKAQEIYNQLIAEKGEVVNNKIKDTKIICLHSRFFDKDRKDKESQLKSLFGKASNNESVILIATQVIEAGMDISCEVMHTEISPINSFLQRAGRCARFSNQTGRIFIYEVLDFEEQEKIAIIPETQEDEVEIRKLNNKYLPYKAELCQRTLGELQKYETLDGNIPDLLIEHILGDEEKDIISTMKTGTNGGFNKAKIKTSWDTCAKNNYRETIRNIETVEITLIAENMCDEIAKHPYRYQSLGMYKWSLVGWLNKVSKSKNFDPEDWLVKRLEENTFIGEIENDEEINFQLTKITEFKNIPNQVYVNAKYFGYSSSFGFNWQYEKNLGFTSPKREGKQKEDEFKPLTKDTFYQHNMGLIGAFEKEFLRDNRDNLGFTIQELIRFIEAPELSKDDFIRAIYLMVLLHDYGKLNDNWQKPMQQYQALKENKSIQAFKEVLAHTDYDSKDENDKNLAHKVCLHKRPAHAGVGAFVAQEIISELFGNNDYLKSGISMAIAKHHSPMPTSYPDFKISESNFQAMQNLLNKFGFRLNLDKQQKYSGDIDGFVFEGNDEYLLYFFFVRILRLCDQKATENLKKYFNN